MSASRRRARRAASASRIRIWSEAPNLATWILAPLETSGVETCGHLLGADGTTDDLTGDAAYVPQADPRVLCADCSLPAMARLVDDLESGRRIGACAICGQTHRTLTHWQTSPDATFVVAAFICEGCSKSAGAAW